MRIAACLRNIGTVWGFQSSPFSITVLPALLHSADTQGYDRIPYRFQQQDVQKADRVTQYRISDLKLKSQIKEDPWKDTLETHFTMRNYCFKNETVTQIIISQLLGMREENMCVLLHAL